MPKGNWVSDGRGGWKRGKIEEETIVVLRGSGDASGFHALDAAQKKFIGTKAKILDMGTTKYHQGHTSRNATVEVDGETFEWPYGWWVLDDGNVLDAPVLVKSPKKSDGIAGAVDGHGNKQVKRLAKEKKQKEEEQQEFVAANTTEEETTAPP